jgi:DNA-binding NtrC family response regulator
MSEVISLTVKSLNLADVKVAAIRAAYAKHNGNKSAIARELGVDRRTVYRLLGAHALESFPTPSPWQTESDNAAPSHEALPAE